jgi:AraC-like DNA-binding protein
MFVETLRRYLETLAPDQRGWLAAVRDAVAGRALWLLHSRPAHAWTLEELAVELCCSRSVLAERFVRLVQLPPMLYLARWRMQLAAQRLAGSTAKLAEIARDVGYESEAAFSRAFKRVVGMSPARWRAARTADPRRPEKARGVPRRAKAGARTQ